MCNRIKTITYESFIYFLSHNFPPRGKANLIEYLGVLYNN